MAIRRPPARLPRDPYAAAVRRYVELQRRDARRAEYRHLVAMGPGWTAHEYRRPRWLGPLLDYVAVPALWGVSVLATIAHPWLLALYVLHLAIVYAAVRWG